MLEDTHIFRGLPGGLWLRELHGSSRVWLSGLGRLILLEAMVLRLELVLSLLPLDLLFLLGTLQLLILLPLLVFSVSLEIGLLLDRCLGFLLRHRESVLLLLSLLFLELLGTLLVVFPQTVLVVGHLTRVHLCLAFLSGLGLLGLGHLRDTWGQLCHSFLE